MKCAACGVLNPEKALKCSSCGRALIPLRVKNDWKSRTVPSEQVKRTDQGYGRQPASVEVDHRTIPGRMKLDYLHGSRNIAQKSLESLQDLLVHFSKPELNLDDLLRDAADLISRQLGIDNVAIGLRDAKDGLYRYRVMAGFREDALEAHRQIAYTKDQFYDNKEFKGTDISKYSRIYLAEDNVFPGIEKEAFNRPALLTLKRRAPTDALEGDYLDAKILGAGDELLGWIEISGTRTMILPDATTVRCVEAIASIVGIAVMYTEARAEAATRSKQVRTTRGYP